MDAVEIGELGRPATVQAIDLRWNDERDRPGFDLLELAREDGRKVRALFEGVGSLRIVQSTATLPVVLQVFDHRTDGWERYAQIFVTNSEQDPDYSFYCSRMIIQMQVE